MMRPAVLIVEDDDAVRESVRLVLEDDCEVVGAPDGSTALTLAGTHLDAVILDLRLPDIDGLEVLRRIRLLAADMPVVILTADASARTAVGAMKLGASEYLTKPFDEAELRMVIHQVIKSRHVITRPGAPTHPPAPVLVDQPRVLIVANHAGRRAAFEVALRGIVTTETADLSDALATCTRATPLACILVDLSGTSTEAMTTARALSRAVPHAEVILARDMGESINRVRAQWRAGDEAAAARPPLSKAIGRAIEYLASRYREEVNVETLAAAVGLAAPRLPHTFRAETGFTIKDFLSKLRVEVATLLLATTSEKVETIAREVGFFDASHLSRTFVDQTGRRPTFYRRIRL